MHTGIDRQKWYLIAMRIGDRDHARGITVPERSNTRQRAAVVPVQWNVVGQDEVDNPAVQSDEDWVIAGGAPDFASSVVSLEFDAASAEVPDSFRPNVRPE